MQILEIASGTGKNFLRWECTQRDQTKITLSKTMIFLLVHVNHLSVGPSSRVGHLRGSDAGLHTWHVGSPAEPVPHAARGSNTSWVPERPMAIPGIAGNHTKHPATVAYLTSPLKPRSHGAHRLPAPQGALRHRQLRGGGTGGFVGLGGCS